jgi:hypothetical protein
MDDCAMSRCRRRRRCFLSAPDSGSFTGASTCRLRAVQARTDGGVPPSPPRPQCGGPQSGLLSAGRRVLPQPKPLEALATAHLKQDEPRSSQEQYKRESIAPAALRNALAVLLRSVSAVAAVPLRSQSPRTSPNPREYRLRRPPASSGLFAAIRGCSRFFKAIGANGSDRLSYAVSEAPAVPVRSQIKGRPGARRRLGLRSSALGPQVVVAGITRCLAGWPA